MQAKLNHPEHWMASEDCRLSLLLALPDPCLLAVLQCLAADDQRSLCSAARSHSRLHQAAVLALRSITVGVTGQEQADGVLRYLQKHAKHVDSLELEGETGYGTAVLGPLPTDLRLCSLYLANLRLQQGDALQRVLGPAGGAPSPLTHLSLWYCKLVDKAAADVLAGTLQQLPVELEHLCISGLAVGCSLGRSFEFPSAVLQRLQQLTFLELSDVKVPGPDEASSGLQSLQALTRLMDLQLTDVDHDEVTASMLSSAHFLTRLDLSRGVKMEPGVLAGKTQLQHLYLDLESYKDAGQVAQLLSHLQHMQQLTYLYMEQSMQAVEEGNPPAAAYSALTASSRLQYLNIRDCDLPADVWQHVFPVERQLPHLQELDISWCRHPGAGFAAAPEGTRLVSCCPRLETLCMESVPYNAAQLAPLNGLSGLHSLQLDNTDSAEEGLGALCQLTRLQSLTLVVPSAVERQGLLLQLTQLQQLTTLAYLVPVMGLNLWVQFKFQAPGDEPVWRQLLRRHLDSSDPQVAQQAAAVLAE